VRKERERERESAQLYQMEGKSRVLVAHTCNPSYSGGRDQKDQGSRPALKIVLETLSQLNPSQKKGWKSGSMCSLNWSSNSNTAKKKKKEGEM
jgi:hypothetical protein